MDYGRGKCVCGATYDADGYCTNLAGLTPGQIARATSNLQKTGRMGDYYMIDNIPADTTNPKDLLGMKKVSLTKLPAVAVIHGAHAMMDGARKYGPYNWREKDVRASIYIDAAMRHLQAWFDGEECAPDSGVRHLGHAIACCGIILDAQAHGCLADDRPLTKAGGALEAMKEIQRKLEAAQK